MSRKVIVPLTEEEKRHEEFLFGFEPKIGGFNKEKFLESMKEQTKVIMVEREKKIKMNKEKILK